MIFYFFCFCLDFVVSLLSDICIVLFLHFSFSIFGIKITFFGIFTFRFDVTGFHYTPYVLKGLLIFLTRTGNYVYLLALKLIIYYHQFIDCHCHSFTLPSTWWLHLYIYIYRQPFICIYVNVHKCVYGTTKWILNEISKKKTVVAKPLLTFQLFFCSHCFFHFLLLSQVFGHNVTRKHLNGPATVPLNIDIVKQHDVRRLFWLLLQINFFLYCIFIQSRTNAKTFKCSISIFYFVSSAENSP